MNKIFCKDKKDFCDGKKNCQSCKFAKGNGVISGYIADDVLSTLFGNDYDLDRLKEIVEADKENRCIVHKFVIGSTVYRLWVYPDGTKPFITENKINNIQDLINAESWTDVYKTKEEAEAALRRMQDEGVH